ncbi:PVC-type heme-binding CxxCH protein [Singulisphaera sp. GP187]|uniref:PVC-type heme-binding CxxCH protein n=1 Tax=Singulisphaera sp. GP187 TaxID=1882752 RepID=UPI0020B12C0B|nr:PVC-type heme-binding CxxCH protein [Singulisphaera sp. GP187]
MSRLAASWAVAVALTAAAPADVESLIFTPSGFDRPGLVAIAPEDSRAHLEIVVLDKTKGSPTPCRLNVIGADGQYYQPADGPLTPYSFTGEWPKSGKGNRQGKAPIRYLGRFFYSLGKVEIAVPPGAVRVEVWKGFEYRPQTFSTRVVAGERRQVSIALERSVDMAAQGYDSGDTHLHFKRENDADDQVIFDLLEAEDIRYGSPLGYNEPAGPYVGVRERLDYPQLRGLGSKSERRRGDFRILSGQEYRSSTYGHLNLFLRDDLVLEGQSLNANNWPLYGLVSRETRRHGQRTSNCPCFQGKVGRLASEEADFLRQNSQKTLDFKQFDVRWPWTRRRGGFAIMAHGGYAQSIYADYVQGDLDGVELLQFGVYRGIGIDDWYRILNIGYRFPCVGASDYPACRKLGDSITYSARNGADAPDFAGWLRATSEGRSFVTTGPLLLLEVDGQRPGALIQNEGTAPRKVRAQVRVLSAVAPVTNLQLIVNGRVLEELKIPAHQGQGNWLELNREVALESSSWIAARAFGTASTGSPDAESHTNPVYVYLDGKAPFNRSDLDTLVGKLDGQMETHRTRDFPEKAKVLDYFQKSRDILTKIRERGGLGAEGVPAAWIEAETPARIDPSARTHTKEALGEFLKPLHPKPAAEALNTFEVIDGFRMELVAAEPLIHSPVAGAFDENGNLYVAEMTDYPFKPRAGQKPLGAIRLLRDLDGDGQFDESHVFADGLLWAAGIAPWKGGVFVTSPPEIWYMKDTDGDHHADVRRKVYTGFGTGNEQGMLNNLTFGLDHRIYGSTSVNGGTIKSATDPNAPAVALAGKDFRFDPRNEALEAITGTVQFGNTFDDDGNRFLCSESRPLMHAVLPLDALARNPFLPVASALENVGGGNVPIFRISPLEGWRQIRSSRRIAHGERSADSAGASHHVVDAASGVTVYRGAAYPEAFYGDVFVSDAQNNLIHRMRLKPNGPTFTSSRVDEKTEFVRSSDNWFRPVNLLNAPDGTLHVLDMSREIIEAIHIPLDVMEHLDLRRGRDQGRIYRIAPVGFQPPPTPRLGSATTEELVAVLENPNSWWRETAHRLIFERQDRSIVPSLRRLLAAGKQPVTRIHALWSLDGLQALTAADLLAAMADPSPRVVVQAIRLAEPQLDRSPAVFAAVSDHANDPDVRVRFTVALHLGASNQSLTAVPLAAIAHRDSANSWMRLAVLSSSAPVAHSLLTDLANDRRFATDPTGQAFLVQLAGIIGARRQPDEIQRTLATIASHADDSTDSALAKALFLALGGSVRQAGGHLSIIEPPATKLDHFVAGVFDQAIKETGNDALEVGRRLKAIELLACGPFPLVHAPLAPLIDPRQPEAVQIASLRALAGFDEPQIAELILANNRQLVPSVRTEAVATLLARESWTLALLKAMASGAVDPGQIDQARRPLLVNHKNEELAALARVAFGKEQAVLSSDLQATIKAALKPTGDRRRGEEVFIKQCMTCHKVGDKGHAVGPDLTTTQFREPESFLTHVLEPNRFVAPNYVQYILGDRGGRVFTGLIASETASSVTIRRADGVEDVILRSQIDELTSTGKSLMPEGLGSKLTPQELADLASFVLASPAKVAGDEKLDVGSLPGLVEPEK